MDSSRVLYLGKRGENLARELAFREPAAWAAEYGQGTVQLAVRPQLSEGLTYAARLEQDGPLTVWPITAADTAYAGYGLCELRWYVGDVVVKSSTYHTLVAGDLGEITGAPPSGGGDAAGVDHRLLSHREEADQHPIGAITGLSDRLQHIPAPVEALSNKELEELLR